MLRLWPLLLCGILLGCGRTTLVTDLDGAATGPTDSTDTADTSGERPADVAPEAPARPDACPGGVCDTGPTCPGGCPLGYLCCGTRCVVPSTDALHCGACGMRCPSGSFCEGSVCVPPGCPGGCPAGSTCCGRACADLQRDTDNCGVCGRVCASGTTCEEGACQPIRGCLIGPPCRPGWACCGGMCIDVQPDDENCGGCGARCAEGTRCVGGACRAPECPRCAPGSTCCAGLCVATERDPENCGACGQRCPAGQSCAAGRCAPAGCGVCAAGQSCCGGRCVDTRSDPLQCGRCGRECPSGGVCRAGACTCDCPAGRSCCDLTCVDLQASLTHCGACGRVCSAPGINQFVACEAGRCRHRCAEGFADCNADPSDGCEAETETDAAHCGACGRRCAVGEHCEGGACVAGGVRCGTGPACREDQSCCLERCTDTRTTLEHCGGCGRPCPTGVHATMACRSFRCQIAACEAGYGDCNGDPADGCEAPLGTTEAHCGGCGRPCPSGQACRAGACGPVSSGREGAFAPMVNPTRLSPGIHEFTTVRVPRGVVVQVSGGGSEAGTLDLRASGEIVLEGTVDLTGGAGTVGAVTDRVARRGRAGTGGPAGEPHTTPEGAVCEVGSGASGSGGLGELGYTGSCPSPAAGCITDALLRQVFTAPLARFGGGGGVFTDGRAFGAGGGGYAGGSQGGLGRGVILQRDCSGVAAGGGSVFSLGGRAGVEREVYNGRDGTIGQTPCDALRPRVVMAWVGGGGGGSIGQAAARDLRVLNTFYPGSGGGGGSADYNERPGPGGTSGGGGGGGALRLWSATSITITGQVLADGGAGAPASVGAPRSEGCNPQPGAAGGGGSGGVIVLRAPTITTSPSARVSAQGGAGGAASPHATGGAGGAGGPGRVRISVERARCSLAGTFFPPLEAPCALTVGEGVPGRAFVGPWPD